MNHLQSFLRKTLTTSLVPLLLSGSFYLLGGKIPQVLSEAYDGYFQFMLMMCFINMIIKAFCFSSKALFKKLRDTKETSELLENEKSSVAKTILKEGITTIIHYSIAYGLYCAFGLYISSLPCGSLIQCLGLPHYEVALPNGIILNQQNHRFLEQTQMASKLATARQSELDSLSLSVGEILGSLDLDLFSVVLSSDEKIAYGTIRNEGSLRVIDLSNMKHPVVIASLPMVRASFAIFDKSLALSHSGKTLYASTFTTLEVIDVSDPRSPQVVSRYIDPDLKSMTATSSAARSLFKISMALSNDDSFLYVAGFGLQIFETKSLDLIYHEYYPFEAEEPIKTDLSETSLALSPDGGILFYADTTLKVYKCSDPQNIKLIVEVSLMSVINSLALLSDSKTLLITGSSENRNLLGKVDVSSPASPVLLSTYPISISGDQNRVKIISVSSEDSHAFLRAYNQKNGSRLRVFNLIRGEYLSDDSKNLISSADFVIMLKGKNFLIAADEGKLVSLELYPVFPSNQNHNLSYQMIASSEIEGRLSSFSLSEDGKTLFAAREVEKDSSIKTYLEIFDASNSRLSLISSKLVSQDAGLLQISSDGQKAFIASDGSVEVYDISNKRSVTYVESLKFDNLRTLHQFFISPDNHAAYVLQYSGGVRIFDLSRGVEITCSISNFEAAKIALSKDGRKLFLFGDKIYVYDVSDLSRIKKVADVNYGAQENSAYITSAEVSAVGTSIYIISSRLFGGSTELTIYDISVLSAPVFLGKTSLPNSDKARSSIAVSADSRKLLIPIGRSLIQIDIDNPRLPKIVNSIAVSDSKLLLFSTSSDEKRAIIASGSIDNKSKVSILSLEPTSFISLKKDRFLLGQLSTENYQFFSESRYLSRKEFKFIKNSLVEMQVIPNESSVLKKASPLPSWIVFDQEGSTISVGAKTKQDVGSYNIYSAISRKISAASAKNIDSGIPNPEDLLTTLVSLGYLDNQLFLTSSFLEVESWSDFLLTGQYIAFKSQIYNFLKQYIVETYNTVEILPSLSISSGDTLVINTLSTNSIQVVIKIDKNQVKFLTKTFAGLNSVINEDHSILLLEGSLQEINLALQGIVIDLNYAESCDGTITVDDHLNPLLFLRIQNLSNYFLINFFPIMNSNLMVQAQIDSAQIYMGNYFMIHLDERTFVDQFNNVLSYSLTMRDDFREFPQWLSMENLVIKGTPPEQLSGRSIPLVLHVKNEFRQISVPFTLTVRITAVYFMKLLLIWALCLVVVTYLLVRVKRVYIFTTRGKYRDGKEFFVKIGEELSSEVIFPVLFVREEKGESELIVRHLEKRISKDLQKRSMTTYELAKHFVSNGDLDQASVLKAVAETVANLPEKDQNGLKIYTRGAEARKLVVNQLILSQLVTSLVERDQATREAFEKIQSRWAEIVEWNPSIGFISNDLRLEGALRSGQVNLKQGDTEAGNQRLLSNEGGINKDLLKNAIASYALECQSLDIMAIRVRILAKEKVGADRIKGCLTLDLEEINCNERGRADYGIDYKIKNSALCFSGIVQEDFQDKTIVVQLADPKERIMKEIWISEDSRRPIGGFDSIPSHEKAARGQSYEIY